jgi:hypothetical protein
LFFHVNFLTILASIVGYDYSPCRLLCQTRGREREILQNRKSLN